jgi:hypothetical protein
MQGHVPSIFIYFNDRIAPAQVRPIGISTGTTAGQMKLSISVSPKPSETQMLCRFGSGYARMFCYGKWRDDNLQCQETLLTG